MAVLVVLVVLGLLLVIVHSPCIFDFIPITTCIVFARVVGGGNGRGGGGSSSRLLYMICIFVLLQLLFVLVVIVLVAVAMLLFLFASSYDSAS